jgi:hypothetical protein
MLTARFARAGGITVMRAETEVAVQLVDRSLNRLRRHL